MKNWLIYTISLFSLVLAVACAKKDSGGTVAQTPYAQGCNIPGSTTCNTGYYQQYGWQNYNGNIYGQGGACGCPVGTRPVMNSTWGVGCAPNTYFQWNAYAYVGYNYQAQNNQWVNTPQAQISGNQYNCWSDFGRSCDTRILNSCGANSTCVPTTGGSVLGLCRSAVSSASNYGCRWAITQWGYYGWVCANYSNSSYQSTGNR